MKVLDLEDRLSVKARIDSIVKFASTLRLDPTVEYVMQSQLARAFANAGIDAKREFALTEHDRPDFLIGDIAIECKVKGTPSEIYRQLCRYAMTGKIRGLILITARTRLPLLPRIEGVMTRQVYVGDAWI